LYTVNCKVCFSFQGIRCSSEVKRDKVNENKLKDPGFDPLPRQTLDCLIFDSKIRNYPKTYRVTETGVIRQRQTQINKRVASKRLDLLAYLVLAWITKKFYKIDTGMKLTIKFSRFWQFDKKENERFGMKPGKLPIY
jgi:hypothetical protein